MGRYSSRPLPKASPYLPGRSQHPSRDPRGQEIVRREESRSFDPSKWETCDEYLYGIDLFNHRYWWEAHEVFEEFWRAAGRDTLLGYFFQGLIQVAAALVKDAVGSRAAARSLARSGCAKLRKTPGIVLGVAGTELASSVEAFLSGKSQTNPCIRLTGGHVG
jgi:hypothetical protein